MTVKAVYHVVPLNRANDQDTLIYNTDTGMAWLRSSDPRATTWSCVNATAIGAETACRAAGFDPVAVVYIRKWIYCECCNERIVTPAPGEPTLCSLCVPYNPTL